MRRGVSPTLVESRSALTRRLGVGRRTPNGARAFVRASISSSARRRARRFCERRGASARTKIGGAGPLDRSIARSIEGFGIRPRARIETRSSLVMPGDASDSASDAQSAAPQYPTEASAYELLEEIQDTASAPR